ncbi:MAG: carboxypeptidase regulatory-like domain-containing protein [Planctomycetes bacterium]|nr:carboxypeptidase regulatory-like domain-containing protein [Planctomycetota bacterium]
MGTRRRLGLVIAAALALSSALVIWWFLQEGPRDPGHVEVEMASQGAHGEKSIARGAGPALEGTPARESGNEVPRYGTLGKPSASSSPQIPGDMSASIRGRVVDGDGRTVSGIHVRLLWSRSTPAANTPVTELHARLRRGDGKVRVDATDKDGAFHFEHLVARTYELRVGAHEAEDEGVRHSVVVGTGEAVSGIELVVPTASRLRGRVVDLQGDPCPKLMLSLRSLQFPTANRKVLTDDDGRFALRVKATGVFEVWGPRSALLDGVVEAGGEEALLRFDPEDQRWLTIRIVDPDGVAVPRAQCVAGTDPFALRPGETNVSEVKAAIGGKLTVPWSELGPVVTVSVSRPQDASGAPMPLQAARVSGITRFAEEAEVRLLAAAPVRGRVVNEAGLPVAGVGIEARTSDDKWPLAHGVSADDGTFEIAGAPAGPLTLVASNPRKGWAAGPPLEVMAPASDVVVRVKRASELVVFVTGPDGKPVADAQVRAFEVATAGPSAQAKTGADGRAVLGGLAPGKEIDVRVDVVNVLARVASLRGALRTTAPGTLPVRLEEPAYVEGVVVDEDGQPLGLEGLVAREPDTMGMVENAVSAAGTGTFRLIRQRRGPVELWVGFGPDNRPPTDPIIVEAPADGVRLVVPRSIQVRGRLVVEDPDRWTVMWPMKMGRGAGLVQADGTFVITDARGPRGALVAFPQDWSDERVAVLEDVDPSKGPFTLVAQPGGSIRGHVEGLRPGSFAVGSLLVWATRGHLRFPGAIAEDGTFTIPRLPAGTWTVQLGLERHAPSAPAVPTGKTDVVLPAPAHLR